MILTKEHIEILDHTINRAANQLFCGSTSEVIELVNSGYMLSAGKVGFHDDEYFSITRKGRELLSSHQSPFVDDINARRA